MSDTNPSNKEKLILVVNDDGITAKGIRALVEAAQQYGKVVVVAPDGPQSAMGHAITISKPLRLSKVRVFEDLGVEGYACTGTPVDCVKLALDKVLDRMPDYCFSGINHGSNSSLNVIYSGTMSAAMEAAMDGVNAIGFSLLNFSSNADFTAAKEAVHLVMEKVIQHGMPENRLLNVNIPNVEPGGFEGLRVCYQAHAKWEQGYDERTDPVGRKYYWLTGIFSNLDDGEHADLNVLKQNYISVVPVMWDLTAHKAAKELREKWG